MTDGPYAESKEQMGGFWVIEVRRPRRRPGLGPQGGRGLRGTDRAPPDAGVTDDLDAVFRREAGRCTATLIRVLGDLDLAEDAVAEAFAIAAAQWPEHGIPPNPGGWITTTARNRAIDRLRRESTRTDRHLAAHRLHTEAMEPDDRPELSDLDRLRRRRPRRPTPTDGPVLPSRARDRRTDRARPSGSSAGSRPTRSHERSSCPRRRWPSGSYEPSASSATTTRRTASRAPPSCPTGSARCSPPSTSSSPRATPRPRATRSYASSSRPRRSASGASSWTSRPTSRRRSASSP